MAKKKTNTKLADRLHRKDRPGRKKPAARKSKGQKAAKPPAQGKDEEHESSAKPAKAVLGKDSSYAANGYRYLKGADGRGVYKNVNHPYFAHIKDLVADHCTFPNSKRPENFNPEYGQDYPYQYQAHHILPAGCFSSKTSSGPLFSPAQMRLLLQSEYNINNGHNIIMLPTQNEYVCVHVLMQHKGSHPQYNAMVLKGLKKIANKLQKIADEEKDHKKVSANVAKELEDLEEAYWNWIVKVSRSVIAKVAGSVDYVYSPVKFATSRNARPWGSLA